MIKFCTQCGSPTSFRIPQGDSLARAVCDQCHHIQYENPRLIVGCVATHGPQILLCRRGIEPRHGLWTLPAGFMENGETSAQGAARETLEEACAVVGELSPFAIVSIARINQVHLFYRGDLRDPDHSPGEESLETALVHPDEIPWDALAFESIRYCLQRYIEDMERGAFRFHETTLNPASLSG